MALLISYSLRDLVPQNVRSYEQELRSQGSLRDEPSLVLAAVGGLGGVFIATSLWIVMARLMSAPVGWMALAGGVIVVFSIRTFGRDCREGTGALAAIMTLLAGCLGHALAHCALIAGSQGTLIIDVLGRTGFLVALDRGLSHSILDLVFMGVAILAAHFMATSRRLRRSSLALVK